MRYEDGIGKSLCVLMHMDYVRHRQLQVRVVWDYDPHTMPAFHMDCLWAKHTHIWCGYG